VERALHGALARSQRKCKSSSTTIRRPPGSQAHLAEKAKDLADEEALLDERCAYRDILCLADKRH